MHFLAGQPGQAQPFPHGQVLADHAARAWLKRLFMHEYSLVDQQWMPSSIARGV